MGTVTTVDNARNERADLLLEQAFRAVTGNRADLPNTLQRALFPRLLSRDTGLLVPTAAGAGRLEAVLVPALAQGPLSDSITRLFIVTRDSAVLDDLEMRLSTYLSALAASQQRPRTAHIIGSDDPRVCRRFNPDNTVERFECEQPLECDCDVVLARLTPFRDLFFTDGVGRARSASGAIDSLGATAGRANLFYFDEAQDYAPDRFASFVRLVEFLFAEDLDIVVGGTTFPKAAIDQLSFLETLYVPEANDEPACTIERVEGRFADQAIDFVLNAERAIVVVENSKQAKAAVRSLAAAGAPTPLVYLSDATDGRIETYKRLVDADRGGEPYLCVVDGPAAESADLSASVVVTGVCAPESLVRRAGLCNRRGSPDPGRIVVFWGKGKIEGRTPAPELAKTYLAMLFDIADPIPFSAPAWIASIG